MFDFVPPGLLKHKSFLKREDNKEFRWEKIRKRCKQPPKLFSWISNRRKGFLSLKKAPQWPNPSHALHWHRSLQQQIPPGLPAAQLGAMRPWRLAHQRAAGFRHPPCKVTLFLCVGHSAAKRPLTYCCFPSRGHLHWAPLLQDICRAGLWLLQGWLGGKKVWH